MPIDLANYDQQAREAVKAFWGNRDAARRKQIEAGRVDQGERAAVTGGQNMDGFIALVLDLVERNGLVNAVVRRNRSTLTLPGFFRPTKLWDLLVFNESRLVAALEFKSHVGPSFGNNFNNRAEEAIGTSVDFQTAYREGAFGEIPRPFVGWLILVEDAPGSRIPVRDAAPNFPVLPDFQGASYMERYNILGKKLVQEQLYTTATVLASTRTAIDSGEYSTCSEITNLTTFVTSFGGHIAAEAARRD
jgi:hypothetical protein